MKPKKPGNSPRPGPEVVKRQRVAQERAAQKVSSWTVQNERGPGTGVGRRYRNDSRFCQSSRDKSLTEGYVVVTWTKQNIASVTRENKFLGGNRGNLCVKDFR